MDLNPTLPTVPRRALRLQLLRPRRPTLWLAWILLALLVAAVLWPAALAPLDPLEANARLAYQPPDAVHWLGTDENGRDVLSRLIHGARPSLLIGVAATVLAVTLGILLGLSAGLAPTWLDNLLMRSIDVLMAFPDLLLALVIIALFGQGTTNLILAIGIAAVPRYARLVRAQTQTIQSAAFVEAATSLGRTRMAVILHHILPNSVQPLLILATLGLGGAITAGAALSFLGFGAPPPAPEWGAMLAIGRAFLANAPWLVAWPALAITLTVVSISTLGREWLRLSEGRAP